MITSGSTVAAIAVSLFDAEIVTGAQFLLLVAGSRLGASGIVVLVGALDYFQKRRYTMGEATSLGLLTFLITHTVYLPATVLAFLGLPVLRRSLSGVGRAVEVSGTPWVIVEPAAIALVETTGAAPAFIIAVALLLVSLTLFNCVLEHVDTTWLRQRFFVRFQHRWVAAALGMLITAATTSIAFYIGVIVPLYNRNYVTRREVVPFILGANIGTFLDTIVVGIVLDAPSAVEITLGIVGVATAITLGILVFFEPYLTGIGAIEHHLVAHRRTLHLFVASLVLVPVVLVLVPF